MNFFEWSQSCLKKNRYDTKDFAIKVKQTALKDRGHKLRVYYCEHCNGWHLTAQLRNKV